MRLHWQALPGDRAGVVQGPSAPVPQYHLRAAEERDLAAAGFVDHDRVPYVRGAAEMDGRRRARDRAVARGAEEIRLQLDRGETFGALRQVGDRAVAGHGVGE